MSIGRLGANVLFYLLLGAGLFWLGTGEVKAQACQAASPATCDQGQALTACNASGGALGGRAYSCDLAGGSSRYYTCNSTFGGGGYSCGAVASFLTPPLSGVGSTFHYYDCPAGTIFNPTLAICAQDCAAKPDYISTPTYEMRNGTVTCSDGCEVGHFANGDGTYTGKPSLLGRACSVLPDCASLGGGYYTNANTGHCELPATECESNQTTGPGGACLDACPSGMHTDDAGLCVQDSDNCPAGEIRSPSGSCLPGDGQCAAGEAKKKDGTCGKDTDGDGEADDDDDDPENDSDKESFSGGDSCDSPPSCSGGPIDCGMARIQWRIDCNTRKDITISGGSCSAIPICTGRNCNAMEYSQLLMQWRTACKAAGEGGEAGNNQDLIDALTGPTGTIADSSGGGDLEDLGPGMGEEAGEDFDPDGTGFGWGSSCPTPPSISFGGRTFTFDIGPMCDWFALGGVLVMILSSLASLRIVSGASD